MRTTNVVRIAFLILMLVAYSSPVLAVYYPDWQEDCNSSCQGGVRVHECIFEDVSGAPSTDPSSVCHPFDCGIFVNCTPTTDAASERYSAMCAGWAGGVGQNGLEWYNQQCWLNEGTAEGSFYCSYNDPGCPE